MSSAKDPRDRPIIDNFADVLKCLATSDEYKNRPPIGPPSDLPALTDQELLVLQQGTSLAGETQLYNYEQLAIIEPHAKPIEVPYPKRETLADLNVCGIDGSNQRIARGSFYFVLTRAAIIEFRYSIANAKPYFYNRVSDASAVIWVDGNIFSEEIRLFTNTKVDSNAGDSFNMLAALRKDTGKPWLLRYDSKRIDKSPSQHALGWAVKLQQALEMRCLADIRTDVRTICIKDGPLFSTSLSIAENLEGLSVLNAWDRQNLVASSKRVQDSRLLVELLLTKSTLRDYWFPRQNLSDSAISEISSDALLLPRILKPGFRTPLIEAIPRARVEITRVEPRLTPLACYYLSRHKPHTYLRLEVPKFQWENCPESVEEALSVTAWQHEMGRTAPLVQLMADERCQLSSEKRMLEYQTSLAVDNNNLDLPEAYE
jgi:hypothetical protein